MNFPLPGTANATVVVPAPAPGPQRWAGAPSAAFDVDGSIVLAYRVRDGSDHNVIARSRDGGASFTTIGELSREGMVERPALVRIGSGQWRMYVSCSTPGSKHWWIGVLEADTLGELAHAKVRRTFERDDLMAIKDPVIRHDASGWRAWICCHPLDVPGAEDRMTTAYATSDDGLNWRWRGTVLKGRPGEWDARGARLTSVLPDGRACYDGRATAEENWFERTGLATPGPGGTLVAQEGPPVADVRYLEVLALPDGGHRIFYEARLPGESHELRTERI